MTSSALLLAETAEGATFRVAFAELSPPERFVAERLDAWWDVELLELARKILAVVPKGRQERILRLSSALASREANEAHEAHRLLQAAHHVGRAVVDRWEAAGLRWARGARRLPVPLAAGARCRYLFANLVSPSGKALFACPSCGSRPDPSPRFREPPECPGKDVARGLSSAVADVLLGGERFELRRSWCSDEDGAGRHLLPEELPDLPLPADGIGRACGRCGKVGAWRGRLPFGYQEPGTALCPACVGVPPSVYRGDQRWKGGP